MSALFGQKVMAASGFLIFGSIGACVLGTTHAPTALVEGVRQGAQTEIVGVNRINKADQITASRVREVEQRLPAPATRMETSLQRPSFQAPPLGCDPAFSPVADPMRAGIYKRCTV